jgi:hypothetical protein
MGNLPALTSLVVSEIDGLPGAGFIAAQNVPRAQAQVFSYDWLGVSPPEPDALAEAARKLPSNGRSLEELEGQKVAG